MFSLCSVGYVSGYFELEDCWGLFLLWVLFGCFIRVFVLLILVGVYFFFIDIGLVIVVCLFFIFCC